MSALPLIATVKADMLHVRLAPDTDIPRAHRDKAAEQSRREQELEFYRDPGVIFQNRSRE
jgi:hypothetical protein